jgi:hypothetical protein
VGCNPQASKPNQQLLSSSQALPLESSSQDHVHRLRQLIAAGVIKRGARDPETPTMSRGFRGWM